ncbi:glycosyltransferase family 4 protein [Candidatus Roizmanbacteria bacterium]|nr:glycosyltransferase family 4 protein [Candidatus Roizmanbacteria bacterium]
MKILILNWKDIKNPKSGGAEVLTHELAKRLVKKGNEVTMFVSFFRGAKDQEIIDGVNIIREGELDLRALTNSVYFKAYLYYKKHFKNKIDIIIDEAHGTPFFAKFYAREKVVALICEVADDIWFRMFSFPWNSLGWLLERIYLFFYRGITILTISPSTKKELIKTGINSKNISVIPMGINTVKMDKFQKEKKSTIIFVGRLNKMKGVEDCIRAFAEAKKKDKNLQLWIVGKGEEDFEKELKRLSKKLGVTPVFWGFISEHKKFELMARAHAIIVPSMREGFGLIVPEAGSVGTPAIVYDVQGLCDTVENNVNGIKVHKSFFALAGGIDKLFADRKMYKQMCIKAKEYSLSYNWDNTVDITLKELKK